MRDIGRDIVSFVCDVTTPLVAAATDLAAISSLVQLSGWDFAAAGLDLSKLTGAAKQLGRDVEVVRSRLGQGLDLEDVTMATLAIGDAVVRLSAFAEGWSPPAGLPSDLPQTFVGDLGGQLLVLFLSGAHPVARPVLEVLGILTYTAEPAITTASGKNIRIAMTRPRVNLSALTSLMTDPPSAVRSLLRLDESPRRPSSAVADDLFPAIAEISRWLGIGAWYGDPGRTLALDPTLAELNKHLLRLMYAYQPDGQPEVLSFELAMVLRDEGTDRVLTVVPTGGLAVQKSTETWTADLNVRGQIGALEIYSSKVEFPDIAGAEIEVEASVSSTPIAGSPLAALGTSGPGFSVAGASARVNLRLTSAGPDPSVGLSLSGLRITPGSGGDGFLAKVLPPDTAATIDLTASWNRREGLRLGGAARLDVDIPVNTSVGPVTIERVRVTMGSSSDDTTAIAARLGLAVSLQLGPFHAAIQGVGLRATLAPAAHGGNAGPLQLGLSLAPPTGVGVAISSPAVSGGGFLLFDEAAGRYAGVFELTLFGTISVKAIALITTKLADGSPGFALLVLITAEGFTPVPLGLGFTLTGIGGLLALNRTVDADAVRDGLRNGVLDSILFVKDPVKNANRVLSTLDKVFPLAADRLLIGPLAEISWGSPTVVKIRLALLLDLPQPIRAVLLAALSVLLPTPDQAIVEVHVDAIGVLDLGKGELALDASLHDSRIAGFTLSGDMALRLNWGSAPGFTLALGGFHPRFPRPAGMRPLNRLALSLTSGDNPRVRFETYLAVTPNTLQMGARVTFRYAVGGFGVDGGGSFDALIQWSPFALDVSVAAWVSLFSPAGTLLALSIAVHVTGPSPWHLTGQASITILFFSITVPFDITLGAAPASPPPVDTVDVAALLWTEISDPHNWQATLPAALRPGVTLTTASGTHPDATVIHPLATLTVRQHAVPLKTPIARLGARQPTAGTRDYRLQATTPAGVSTTDVTDLFSPGQYARLTDDQLITTPAFTPAPAGLQFQPTAGATPPTPLRCDHAVTTLDITALDQPPTAGTTVVANGPPTPPLATSLRRAAPLTVTR